jgi:beta-lactamase regulating signal transducer with metallopeptidase domain
MNFNPWVDLAPSFGAHAWNAKALLPALHDISQNAATAFVTSLWQGLAVAVGLAICMRFAPRMAAAHRFAIWAAGFAAVVGLPFLPAMLRFAHLEGVVGSGSAGHAASTTGLTQSWMANGGAWIRLDPRWTIAIAGLWVVASMVRAADLAIHCVQLRKLWKTALPVEFVPGDLLALATTAKRFGRRPVEICTTTMLQRPSVIGFFAPRILIPDWLRARLTQVELEQIVLHETEHLRRHDDWTNLLQKLCLLVFPLNPTLWWMERKLCQDREMACDEGVVKRTHAPRAYAACLTRLAERGLKHRREAALSLGAWKRRSELVDRVHGILSRKAALRPAASGALLGVLACGLVFGSMELARCPQIIAFVAAPREGAVAVVGAGSQLDASAQMVRTGFEQGPAENNGTHFYATNLSLTTKANTTIMSGKRPAIALRNSAIKTDVATNELLSRPTRPRSLKTSAVDPVTNGDGQQWIVFTAWEQVETSSLHSLGDSADAALNGDAAMQVTGSANEAAGQTNQVTVTRFILRVLPANFLSSESAEERARNGWFVIQL